MAITLEGSSSNWVLMRRRQRARRSALVKNKKKKIMIRPKKSLEPSRRLIPNRAIRQRVKTLKELVPNTKDSSSEGLDGLFRQTANYILALEMKVKVMQTMVQVLTQTHDCV